MVKKLRLNIIRNLFKKEGLFVFSPFDLQKYFNVSANTASLFLSRNVKRGNIVKLKRKLYAFDGEHVNELLLANKIYEPSYISFEYALMFYSIIPETVYTITSATTRITREFEVKNIGFFYHHIKKQSFTGYVKKYFNGQMAFLAEPEKALSDYLYFVVLGRKVLNERLDLQKIQKSKVMRYAHLFGKDALMALIEKIYAQS